MDRLGAVHKLRHAIFDHYGPPPPPRHTLSHTDVCLMYSIVTLADTPPPPLQRDVIYERPPMDVRNFWT